MIIREASKSNYQQLFELLTEYSGHMIVAIKEHGSYSFTHNELSEAIARKILSSCHIDSEFGLRIIKQELKSNLQKRMNSICGRPLDAAPSVTVSEIDIVGEIIEEVVLLIALQYQEFLLNQNALTVDNLAQPKNIINEFLEKKLDLKPQISDPIDKDSQIDSCTAAIKFALETDEGLTFLRLWSDADFPEIREEWPECPDSVFRGCDPLFSVAETSTN